MSYSNICNLKTINIAFIFHSVTGLCAFCLVQMDLEDMAV